MKKPHQTTENLEIMIEDTTPPTEQLVAQLGSFKQKALALKLHPDNQLIIIPVDSITKIVSVGRDAPTTTINGFLVKNTFDQVMAALDWEIKVV